MPGEQLPGGGHITVIGVGEGKPFHPKIAKVPEPIKLQEQDLVWKPDNALFIGFGGSGYQILAHVMKNFCDAGKNKLPKGIRFLIVNTDEYEKISEDDPLSFAGFSIPRSDLFILDENLDQPMRNWIEEGVPPELSGWFNPRDYPLDEKLDLKRGTHGDRRLARVAFLRNIQGKTKFSEWRKAQISSGKSDEECDIQFWIKERCKDVVRENRVRIVIAGSLVGGMSGTLCDLALLARKAGLSILEGGGAVEIEAFLLDSKPFQGLVGYMGDAERNANCYAALREISRWQINPSNYPQSAGWYTESNVLSDRVREPLFNKMYLFSEPPGGKIGGIASGSESLTRWIIPSVADVISIMMDTASGAAGPADLFKQGAVEAATRQKQEHQLMVSRAGIYTIRFPIADILKSIHAQLALELILSRLTGKRDGEVDFDYFDVNDSELPGDPNKAIEYFLSGEFDSFLNVAAAAEEKIVSNILIENYVEIPVDVDLLSKMEEFKNHFSHHLQAMLIYILLATNEGHQSHARAAHIAYALEFLNIFLQRLNNARAVLSSMGENYELRYKDLLKNCIEIVEPQIKSLQQFKSILVGGYGEESSRGLVDDIKTRVKALEIYIEKMNEVVCRKYLWNDLCNEEKEKKYRDIWMERYANQVINPENLSRLNWVFTKDYQGNYDLDLELVVIPKGKETTIRLRRDGLQAFNSVFEEWISQLTHEVWNEYLLGKIIPEKELFYSDKDGRSIADIIQPLNRLNSADDPSAGRTVILEIVPQSITERFHPDTEFNVELKHICEERESSSFDLKEATITDPLAAVFLVNQDAICVNNMDTYQRIRLEYDAADGFDLNTKMFNQRKRHQRSVFRADYEARRVEMETGRMPNYLYHPYSEFGLLHPLVAASLQFPEKAEVFCLGIAEGLVRLMNQVDIQIMSGENSSSLIIENFGGNVDPYVNGLLCFALNDNLPENWESVYEALKNRYDTGQFNKGKLDEWRRSIPRQWKLGTTDNPEKRSLGNLVVFLSRFYLSNNKRRWSNG